MFMKNLWSDFWRCFGVSVGCVTSPKIKIWLVTETEIRKIFDFREWDTDFFVCNLDFSIITTNYDVECSLPTLLPSVSAGIA